MQKSKVQRVASAVAVAVMSLMVWVQPAEAAKPILDSGNQIDTTKPYEGVQDLGNVFENRGIYGKLEGNTPVDIYSFTSDRDGEQTFSLLVKPQQLGLVGKPTMIILDKTDATKDEQLPLPIPAEGYHTGIINATENQTYFDAGLMAKYTVVAQQNVVLKKDTQYFFIILDQSNTVRDYVIRTGTGRPWTFGDVFSNLDSWVQVKTDSYAGSGPFSFEPKAIGLMIYFLGLFAFLGMWLVQQLFSLMANRSKPAGYLLVKLQPFAKITMWVGLWFWALGGYIFFNRIGWFGIPFVLFLIFLAILILNLVQSIIFSPRVAQLEVTKKEATIPLALRKHLFIFFIFDTLLILAYIIFNGMLFVS